MSARLTLDDVELSELEAWANRLIRDDIRRAVAELIESCARRHGSQSGSIRADEMRAALDATKPEQP